MFFVPYVCYSTRGLENLSSLTHSQNSQSPKAFLFDIKSRLYIATDASPVDSATHNLCCDYLQMLNSFGPLYRYVLSSCVTTYVC
jgi:hypothetical protein